MNSDNENRKRKVNKEKPKTQENREYERIPRT